MKKFALTVIFSFSVLTTGCDLSDIAVNGIDVEDIAKILIPIITANQ